MLGSFAEQKAKAKAIASFYEGGLYSEEGGYTGDGNKFTVSKRVGEKPYQYEHKEFIFDNEKTTEHRKFFEALHTDTLLSYLLQTRQSRK